MVKAFVAGSASKAQAQLAKMSTLPAIVTPSAPVWLDPGKPGEPWYEERTAENVKNGFASDGSRLENQVASITVGKDVAPSSTKVKTKKRKK